MAATTDPATAPAADSGSQRLARDALLIAVLTIAARVVGFGRVVAFARTVGPTCVGDVYTTANTIPNIVFDVVAGGALSGLIVPVLAGRFAAGDRDSARRIVGALFGWTLLLLVPLALIGALLAGPLMSLLIGGGHPGCHRAAEVALGGDMLRVFAPQVVLYGVGIVAAGTLQARRRFLGPAVAPLLSSLVVIATYVTYRLVDTSDGLSTSLRLDTAILAVGTTLGVVVLSLPLLPPVLASLRPTLRLRFPNGVGTDVRRLAVAGAVVLGSQQLATAVVLRLANARGTPGAVVAWNLGWTVFLVPWAVLAVPIATSAFPRLTVAWTRNDTASYADTVTATTRSLLVVSAGATALLIATADPVARVLVAGAPGAFSPPQLARVLVGFGPGVIGFGLTAHLSRVRFARSDARRPAVAAAVGWLVAVIADLLVVGHVPAGWVPAVLAGATSLGVTISAAVLLIVVFRDTGVDRRGLVRTASAAAAGWVVAAAVGVLVASAAPVGSALEAVGVAALTALVTAGLGLGIVLILDRASAQWLRERLRRG